MKTKKAALKKAKGSSGQNKMKSNMASGCGTKTASTPSHGSCCCGH